MEESRSNLNEISIRTNSHKLHLEALNQHQERAGLLLGGVRSHSLILIFSVVFLVLFFVTAYTQITVGAESAFIAEGNLLRQEILTPPRGLFYDVNGNKLNRNELSYSLEVVPQEISQELRTKLIPVISEAVEQEENTISELIDQAPQDKLLTIASGLSSAKIVRLETDLRDTPVKISAHVHRKYLYPSDFAHVIGYTGEASEEDVAQGFVAGDEVGKYRLEKILDSQLRGVSGKQLSQGQRTEEIPGIPGNNVFLTIDLQWQHTLNNILEDQLVTLGADSGAAVIVDVETGDIAAYTGYPSFDPNKFAAGISSKDYSKLSKADGNPLVDKVTGLQASPGSTFKPLTALSLLQNDTINSSTNVNSTGCMKIGNYDFCEFGKFYLGDLNVVRALTRSSNIFFCTGMLDQVAEKGYDEYLSLANQLGIGVPTGINLDGELTGVMASPEYKQKTFGEGWFGGDTCNTSIGQGMVVVTPLQMAMMIATIANGGDYNRPNLISKIVDQNGKVIKDNFREVLRSVKVSEENRNLVLEGMRSVVSSPEGTAYRFLNDLPGNFRAKTGSAEAFEDVNGKLEARVHGWVVGTFEYKGRTYAFSVHLHFGGGGWNTTPVIQRFGNCLFKDFEKGCEHL